MLLSHSTWFHKIYSIDFSKSRVLHEEDFLVHVHGWKNGFHLILYSWISFLLPIIHPTIWSTLLVPLIPKYVHFRYSSSPWTLQLSLLEIKPSLWAYNLGGGWRSHAFNQWSSGSPSWKPGQPHQRWWQVSYQNCGSS